MKIETKAVHAGDRKKTGAHVAGHHAHLHRLQLLLRDHGAAGPRVRPGGPGYCYARYDNPTNAALEELVAALESGHGALACASGMAAVHMALLAALTDRRKSVLAANALYGATISLLMNVLEPPAWPCGFADVCDLDAFRSAVAESKPGCVLMETISNPLLRVARSIGSPKWRAPPAPPLMVDNTFATPLLVRPLELGAHFAVHSVDQVSGRPRRRAGRHRGHRCSSITTALRTLSRTIGPVLGPFESYLTMRGIKTLPLRMERQCANACRVASWLASHPAVERVYFPATRRIRTPPPSGACCRPDSTAPWCSFEFERRRPRGSLPLHGRARDDRARARRWATCTA